MSAKRLSALAGVLVVLLFAIGALRTWKDRGRVKEKLWSGDPAQVRRIRLARGAQSLTLEKKEARWELTEPRALPADSVAAQDLLDRLSRVELSAPLSDKPAKHALFEVDASSGVRATLLGPGETPDLDVWVGKSAEGYDTFYARREGEDRVREASGLSRHLLERKPKEWADKTVLSVRSDGVEELRLKNAQGALAFRREGGAWRVVEPAGSVLSSDTVKARLEPLFVNLVRMEADDVALLPEEAPKRPGLDKPVLVVELTETGGKRTKLTVGSYKDDTNRHYARKVGEDRLGYLLYPWRFEALQKGPKDFK